MKNAIYLSTLLVLLGCQKENLGPGYVSENSFANAKGGSPTNASINRGMAAFYPFNGSANDESGSGYHGTVNGATLTGDRFGKPNSAYLFNGNSNYIRIPGIDCSSTNKFTISVWVKPSDLTSRRYFTILRQEEWGGPGTYDNLDWLLAFQEYGTILCFGLTTGTQNTTINPSAFTELDIPIRASDFLNSWHLITAVYDGKNKYVYVDGKQLPYLERKSGNIVYSSHLGAIGSTSATIEEFFNGSIDDVRIYKRALSPTEIQYLSGN